MTLVRLFGSSLATNPGVKCATGGFPCMLRYQLRRRPGGSKTAFSSVFLSGEQDHP